jgi:hypothetical protein
MTHKRNLSLQVSFKLKSSVIGLNLPEAPIQVTARRSILPTHILRTLPVTAPAPVNLDHPCRPIEIIAIGVIVQN